MIVQARRGRGIEMAARVSTCVNLEEAQKVPCENAVDAQIGGCHQETVARGVHIDALRGVQGRPPSRRFRDRLRSSPGRGKAPRLPRVRCDVVLEIIGDHDFVQEI